MEAEKHISDDKKICTIFNNFFSNVVSDLKIPILIIIPIKTHIFFYVGFLSRTFMNHRTAGEGAGHFINSSLSHRSASQALRY